MKTYSVIGLGYGDEGKGVTVDYLAKKHMNDSTIVVRHSGGHQVGHGVMFNGKVHEFRNFGSGTFRNVPTYWSKRCTIFPISFHIEYMDLVTNYDKIPSFFCNPQCPIVTLYDIAYNRLMQSINNHGSVGMGFAAAFRGST